MLKASLYNKIDIYSYTNYNISVKFMDQATKQILNIG